MNRTKILLLVTMLLACVGTSRAGDVFTVHGRNNCNTTGSANGITRTLAAGTHYFTIDGAVSFWSSDGQNGGNTWVVTLRVYDLATGTVHPFGGGVGFLPTATDADASVDGVVFEFDLPQAADVRFVVNDGGGCGDNRGTMIITLDDPAVPVEGATWSTLKATYR
jgi:hypothetical protein